MRPDDPPIIVDIVSQHVEEAAFLWCMRQQARWEPLHRPEDLRELEDRLEAHLDGLRIAGEPGWALMRELLDDEDEGEVFVPCVLALESGDPARVRSALAYAEDPETAEGLVSALGWLPWRVVSSAVHELLLSEHLGRVRVGLLASAAHQRFPGEVLEASLSSSDEPLRCAALQVAGLLDRGELTSRIQASLQHDSAPVQELACAALVRLGQAHLARRLYDLARARGEHPPHHQLLAVRAMEPGPQRTLFEELQRSDPVVAARAAGAAGRPEWVPWLLDQMRDPDVARQAYEAFALVTGADLEDDTLLREPPEGFAPGPSDDPEDEDVAMDPDEDLPWPDIEAVRAWWGERASGFRGGNRYLLGVPWAEVDEERLRREGFVRQVWVGTLRG
ncbi:MAG: TIGR02270 family protein [Alphaproteobacteria bacterium]|nr:TIGR02270 family protein [Alphaproteobacteria bacterium]